MLAHFKQKDKSSETTSSAVDAGPRATSLVPSSLMETDPEAAVFASLGDRKSRAWPSSSLLPSSLPGTGGGSQLSAALTREKADPRSRDYLDLVITAVADQQMQDGHPHSVAFGTVRGIKGDPLALCRSHVMGVAACQLVGVGVSLYCLFSPDTLNSLGLATDATPEFKPRSRAGGGQVRQNPLAVRLYAPLLAILAPASKLGASPGSNSLEASVRRPMLLCTNVAEVIGG
jgi:hypothetical protein